MFLIRDIKKIRLLQKSCHLQPLALTIGNFDGFHLGHQKIISDLKNISQQKKLTSAILTFNPHPAVFFNRNLAKNFKINSTAQKIKILKDQKIEAAIFINFNEKIANLEAEEFVSEILVKSLNVKFLLVGYDFIFGKNRLGNFDLLSKLAFKYNFELAKISAHKFQFNEDFLVSNILSNCDKICSSTLIRNLIRNGEIRQANQLMKRNFKVSSSVIEGRKLARILDFPTANMNVNEKIIYPKFGVYKSLVSIVGDDKKYHSITNFGIKPTIENIEFRSEKKPIYETHIFNFDQNLYHKKISVELIDFIRDEKKFSSLDELKNQIKQDVSKIIS